MWLSFHMLIYVITFKIHGPIHLEGNFHIHCLTFGYILCHFQGCQFKEKNKCGRSSIRLTPYVIIYKISYRPRQRLGSTCMYKGKEQIYNAGFIILHLCETNKSYSMSNIFQYYLEETQRVIHFRLYLIKSYNAMYPNVFSWTQGCIVHTTWC